MITMYEALDIIMENSPKLDATSVEFENAYGMVSAEDIISDINIPPFNKSTRDGYAVRATDLKNPPSILKITDEVPAGKVSELIINKGECVKIMTGAPVPRGADAVIEVEYTEPQSDRLVKIMQSVNSGDNISPMGEDTKTNQVVIKKGTIISVPEVAILASVGKLVVKVYRKPRMAILSTGSEISEPGTRLNKGKIRNSNGPMLYSLGKQMGCDVSYLGIAKDNEKELRERIKKGLEHDVFLVSGGVSVGDFDLVPQTLVNEKATILFHKVTVKPGKPLLFGKTRKSLIFGIPGNPVPSFTTFHLFVKPAIYKMMGMPDCELRFIDAQVKTDIEKKGDRSYIIPSKYSINNGRGEVIPFKLHGSADIIGCTGCNCLIILDKELKLVKKGESVEVLLLEK